MDKENEDIDSKNNDDDKDIDENLENTEEETEEEYSDEETDVDVLKKQKKDLFARAKKAETESKKLKKEKKEEEKTAKKDDSSNDSEEALTRDEAMLIAGGVDAEDLEQLKAIQKGTGVSLSEAVKNPMYEAYKEKKVAEAKRKKAQLGAGSGSGKGDNDDINKPGLTEEEHRKLWAKKS